MNEQRFAEMRRKRICRRDEWFVLHGRQFIVGCQICRSSRSSIPLD
jgi:hypothetical protein